MKQVAHNVYAYFQEKGSWGLSNSGLIVGRDYCIVIDSLSTIPQTQALLTEIKKITNKPIRYLINTHYHPDHILGNHLFPGSISICQTRCREQTLGLWEKFNQAVLSGNQALLLRLFPDRDLTGTKVTPQDVTFDKRLTIHLDGREIHLIHYKTGHTVGDITAWLPEESIVFAGDLLFLYSTPVTWEGSFSGWIEIMQALADLNAKVYIPGHGPQCDKQGVLASRDYLVRIYEIARRRFDVGISAYDAAKDIDLGNFKKWANWERILANVERLYREFRGEDPLSELDFGTLRVQMGELARSERQE